MVGTFPCAGYLLPLGSRFCDIEENSRKRQPYNDDSSDSLPWIERVGAALSVQVGITGRGVADSFLEVLVTFRVRDLPRITLTAAAGIIATLISAPPVIVLSLITGSPVPGYAAGRSFGWIVSKMTGVSASLNREDKIVPGESYIVTPNHAGNADILAILTTLPIKFRWVIKKELVKIPLFGWALGRTGAVALDRSNRREAVKKLREGSSKLSNGWSLLIYPEGTRSPDGNLQRFKKGAFMLAVDTGVPILPVTINGAFPLLPKNTLALRSGHMTITIGDPIPTAGLTEKDVPELMEKTRAAISENFDPGYDPWNSALAD